MNGWGSRQLTITPDGTVLPCPAATVIRDLNPPNVADAPLAHIWSESPAFTRFRGTSWLPEPCHSCPAREADFGGCRCQADQLLGNAAATDPVCHYSPRRHTVDAALAAAASAPSQPLIYRTYSEIVWLGTGWGAPTRANANRTTGLPNSYDLPGSSSCHSSLQHRAQVPAATPITSSNPILRIGAGEMPNYVTHCYGILRTGWNPNETFLTSSVIRYRGSTYLGQMFAYQILGL